MKNQLIAALLISSAVIATPAFAGNANLGNDVENWAGPSVMTRAQVRDQLIASEKANQYSHTDDNLAYPAVAENGPTKTRAEVKQELADAAAQGERNNYDNTNYPSTSAPTYAAAQTAPRAQSAVAQGNGLPTRSNP